MGQGSVLQCVAVCCSVLQCVAVFKNAGFRTCWRKRATQGVAGCCSVMQRVAACCSVSKSQDGGNGSATMQRPHGDKSILGAPKISPQSLYLFQRVAVLALYGWGCAVCCSVLQRVAACCSMLQRVAACCSVLQHVAVLAPHGWDLYVYSWLRCM